MDASLVGYSSIGIILAMTTGTILVLAILTIGDFFRYNSKRTRHGGPGQPRTMPLVGTCSAAISANCHRHEEDLDCSLLPLTWGFVKDVEGGFTIVTLSQLRALLNSLISIEEVTSKTVLCNDGLFNLVLKRQLKTQVRGE
jgi:hypothetical protein